MTGLRFADIELDQRLPPVEHEITQEVIDRTALAHLDLNPVHTDRAWAERARVFGGTEPVTHGMFTISVMASVIHRAWHRDGAWIIRTEAKLTKPLPVGQTIVAEGRVRELHPVGAGHDFVLVRVTARDADGGVVGVGDFRVRIPS